MPMTSARCSRSAACVHWVRFSTGEAKVCDFTPLLSSPAFSPLRDAARFAAVYIDYGVPTWEDGTIDIAPEYLYQNGVPA